MLAAAIGAIIVPLRTARASHGRLSVAVFVLVPAVAAGFYAGLGSPDAVTSENSHQYRSEAETNTSSESRTSKSVGSVASMLDGLKERLENEPGDAGGWLLLAKSYKHLGQTEEANAAYERARSLGKSDAAFEQPQVTAKLTEEAPPAESGPALRGRVSLSADAEALVGPGDVVFIFAKESAEHRMPVAALRKPAAELPIEFALTDRNTMVSGTSLANFEQLVVTAKISRSGLATEAVEGLEVWSDPVSPLDGQTIELLLTANTDVSAQSVGGSNE
jgi:hypothetical protein